MQLKLSQVIHGTNYIMHCEAHLHTCTIYDFLTHILPQVHVVFGTTWSKYTNLLYEFVCNQPTTPNNNHII